MKPSRFSIFSKPYMDALVYTAHAASATVPRPYIEIWKKKVFNDLVHVIA